MIRWFKTRRALLAELAELQTAFDSLAASFDRHRIATRKTADLQQQTLARLDAALDRMRVSRMYNRPLVWQAQDAINEDAEAKRREDV